MIRTVILCSVLLMLLGCAGPRIVSQPDSTPMPDVAIERVFEFPGLSKKQIFDRSRQWMALTFVSSKKAIEYEEAEVGKIIGNGVDTITHKIVIDSTMLGQQIYATTYEVRFVVVEDMKDGKAKVAIKNFQVLYPVGGGGPMYADGWKQMEPKLIGLCKGLEEYILKGDNQNW